MFGAAQYGPGKAWAGAAAQAQNHNAQALRNKPAAERLAMGAGADQLRADFAPEPAQQQPMQQQHLLHGLMDRGHAANAPQDYRVAAATQHFGALNKAVDDVNDAWAKEMDRRADAAREAREQDKDMAVAQMRADSEARHDEAVLMQDRERRGFLQNLLAGAGAIPHTVRFGG